MILSCSPNNNYDSFGDPPTPETCFCDPEGVETYLKWLWSEYPDLTDLRTIGYSESGRKIYVLEISDNPGEVEEGYFDYDDVEPNVLINGGIHGHEQIGVGIPMKLAEHLLKAYYDDDYDISFDERSKAIYIIENFRLHIMPSLNPDGLGEYPYCSRYNDNYVDLNRNFGWNYVSDGSNNGDTAFDQSESTAVRDDFAKFGYCLALNMHTASSWEDGLNGGVGIYAPWDSVNTTEGGSQESFIINYLPNYIMIEDLGSAYSDSVVSQGIYPFDMYFHYSEGADWYDFGGSMADWALGTYGTVSYSIELYGDQNFTTDDYFLLEQTWDANRSAMIEIILSAELGTGGRVVDQYGSPVAGAVITLHTDNPPLSRSVTPIEYPDLKALSDSDGWFRLLTGDGSYEITIEKPGFYLLNQTLSVSTELTSAGSRGMTNPGSAGSEFYPEYELTPIE